MDYRECLETDREELIETPIAVHEELWDYLLQYGVVDQETATRIQEENPLPERQISDLLYYLLERPLSCYTNFRRALYQTTQHQALRCIPPLSEFSHELGTQTDESGWNQEQMQNTYDQEIPKDSNQDSAPMADTEKQNQEKDKYIHHLEQNVSTHQQKIRGLEQTIRRLERHLLEAREEVTALRRTASIRQGEVDTLKQKLGKKSAKKPLVMLDTPVWDLSSGIERSWHVTGLTNHEILLATCYPSHDLKHLSLDGSLEGPSFRAEDYINAIIPQGDTVLVLEQHGRISRCRLDDLSRPTHTWRVDVGQLYGAAALSHDRLVCTDCKEGQVFTCTLRGNGALEKYVKLTGLDGPNTIACEGKDMSIVYAVTEFGGHVRLYNARWQLQATIGSYGIEDGKLDRPYCCIFLPSGSLLVADTHNDRVTEFSRQGEYMQHWLTARDGITQPLSLSFVSPHLWVVYGKFFREVTRFKIFEEKD